jgi:hypothetical protein
MGWELVRMVMAEFIELYRDGFGRCPFYLRARGGWVWNRHARQMVWVAKEGVE